MKRAILVAVVAVLLFANSGCGECIAETMFRNMLISIDDSANNEILAYMEEKYGEKFEYIGSGGGLSIPGVRNVLVSCESLPGREILVSISGSGKSKTYKDNFMEHYFKKPVEEYISNVAKNYFDDFTFGIYLMSNSSENIYHGMTLDEYMQNENLTIWSTMKIENFDEETILEFLYELKRLGIHFAIGITIISADEIYDARYYRDYEDIKLKRRG